MGQWGDAMPGASIIPDVAGPEQAAFPFRRTVKRWREREQERQREIPSRSPARSDRPMAESLLTSMAALRRVDGGGSPGEPALSPSKGPQRSGGAAQPLDAPTASRHSLQARPDRRPSPIKCRENHAIDYREHAHVSDRPRGGGCSVRRYVESPHAPGSAALLKGRQGLISQVRGFMATFVT